MSSVLSSITKAFNEGDFERMRVLFDDKYTLVDDTNPQNNLDIESWSKKQKPFLGRIQIEEVIEKVENDEDGITTRVYFKNLAHDNQGEFPEVWRSAIAVVKNGLLYQ